MNIPILLSILTGSFLFLILHISLWRLRPSNSPRVFLLASLAGIGLLGSGITLYSLEGVNAFDAFVVFGTGFFMVNIYFAMYGALARSVSVSLVTRLLEGGNSPLDFDTVLKEYDTSGKFEERIQVMHDAGLVTLSGDTVRMTARGRLLSWTAEQLARLITEGLEGEGHDMAVLGKS
jgi:hypothetical protein